MTVSPTRFGVIACGAIAQRRHLPELHANPDAAVVAVVDPKKDRAQEVAGKYDALAFYQYEDMLAADDELQLDACVVCGPNDIHARQTLACLGAGKHVLVEKPMAATRDDAKAMIKAADKAGKFLMIGMNQRLMPPHVKAKSILDRGELGRVLTFQTSFKHPGPDGWSLDGASSWFFDHKRAIMGVTGDLGVHKVDLLRFLIGEEFTHVGGFLETRDKTHPNGKPIKLDDNAFLTLKTESGAIGTITISWTNYGRPNDNNTILYCERGVLCIGDDPEFGVVAYYRDGGSEYHKVGELATNTRQTDSGVSRLFTRCIREGTPPAIDGDEGYRAVNVILTAMEAAKSGRMERIKY